MADVFTQGTKEYYLIDLSEKLGIITDLTGSGPVFDLRKVDGSYAVVGSTGIVNPANKMEIMCLIDTTVNGNVAAPSGSPTTWLAGGPYRVYLTLSEISETPRFGPFAITIDDS